MPDSYSRKLHIPFEEVLTKVTETLKAQGFGIVTSLNMKDTFKQRLGVDFRKYTILGACNPEFAYKALTLESHIGQMLPCNIVVQQHENGEVEVSASNPLDMIDKGTLTTQLKEIATEVGNRLRIAIDDLFRDTPGQKHEEALPTK